MSTISVGFYFVSNQLRLPCCVNYLSWILFCIKPAQPGCGPLEEGVSTTLTCGSSCAPGATLYWSAERGIHDLAICDDYFCGAYPEFDSAYSISSPESDIPFSISPPGSTLTINSVSRSGSFNMETRWTCRCHRGGIDTVCGKLQVYGQFLFFSTLSGL